MSGVFISFRLCLECVMCVCTSTYACECAQRPDVYVGCLSVLLLRQSLLLNSELSVSASPASKLAPGVPAHL